MKSIGILIPHHSNTAGLVRALKPLSKWPCFVVADGPIQPINLPLEVTLIQSPEIGFSKSVNIGLSCMQRQGFSHVLVLNDDALIDAKSVHRLIAAIHQRSGAIGPLVIEKNRPNYGYRITRWGRITALKKPDRPQVLTGTCILIPSWARFDPAYPHGIEDFDLCLRLSQLDLEICCIPEAVCRHDGGKTLSKANPLKQRASVYGQLKLFNGNVPLILIMNGLQVIKERGSWSRMRAVFEGYMDYRKGQFDYKFDSGD